MSMTSASAESFWSSLKRELVHRSSFVTRAEPKAAITAWISRYNLVRLHSAIGMMPPSKWEIRLRSSGRSKQHKKCPASGGNLRPRAREKKMKAVLLRPNDGAITVEEVPAPRPGYGRVLVRNHLSLLSAGTERARIETGKESLIGKARARPDQARLVIENLKRVGPLETWKIVSDRLSAPILTGYSSSGTVIEVGTGVDGVRPGQLVACAGAGYANHAELVVVPQNLCAVVPAGVSARDAAFGTVGAIALQGIHQAAVGPGSRIVVIGLGLVGQLTVQLLVAYGYDTLGIDQEEAMVELAEANGARAYLRSAADIASSVEHAFGGGADAAIVTAASRSADPVELAGSLVRDRATVVIVGDVLVAPPRPSYYGKELTITYSRSYGPGRYDPLYEEAGIEYPEGYVPWDERRNLQEILRLLSVKRLDFDALAPVTFPVDRAPEAFELLTAAGDKRRVALLLDYGGKPGVIEQGPARPIVLRGTGRLATGSKLGIAAIGAGSFATRMLFPALSKSSEVTFSFIASASGVTSRHQGTRWEFARAVSDLDEGMETPDTDAVLVVTRHDSHGRYAAEVLAQGLGLFCEKPLALTEYELEEVAAAWNATDAVAMVGFNRRFSPAVRKVRASLGRGRGPLQISCRVFAGKLRADHWYFQPDQGGRIVGEVCHFVDLANWIAGGPPVAVTGIGIDSTDPAKAQSVSALLAYADGSTASILYGGLTPTGAPKELIEVAADGFAARIDDFASVQIWGSLSAKESYRGGPKGHAEEMAAFVDLLRGRAAPPGADFVLSLWSTLATLRLASSVQSSGVRMSVVPASPALSAALGVSAHASDDDAPPTDSGSSKDGRHQ
jgi:predicted dehydrogenase/threonine dehydrogenase-like Zn-dependent dehydrogenase